MEGVERFFEDHLLASVGLGVFGVAEVFGEEVVDEFGCGVGRKGFPDNEVEVAIVDLRMRGDEGVVAILARISKADEKGFGVKRLAVDHKIVVAGFVEGKLGKDNEEIGGGAPHIEL